MKDTVVSILKVNEEDYISLTDMLKAKDGDFLFSNWLRNRNTVEFLGIWEQLNNPHFNCAEFDIIKSQAGLNSYRLQHQTNIYFKNCWLQPTKFISLCRS